MSGFKRFYYNGELTGQRLSLDAKQAHHLLNVLRLKKGAEVEVFNDKGISAIAIVASISQKSVELELSSGQPTAKTGLDIPPFGGAHLALATSVPKLGGRMDWLVEKTAELGLKQLIPLITQRSIIRDVTRKLPRWQNVALAAAKQTGQNHILQIQPAVPFSEIITQNSNYDLCLIAVPSASSSLEEIIQKSGNINRILYLIGPEGDFTPDEVTQAVNAGFKAVRLPVDSILRVETAAVAMLAMLFYATKKT